MHIFIDETGSFSGIGNFPSVSMVGALIVPDCRIQGLEKDYAKIRPTLSHDKGEVKGRLLEEKQIASVVPILRQNSALFEVFGIDLGTHTENGLRAFQAEQAERMTRHLTDEHKETLKKQVWEYRRRFEAFSVPLVVQTMLTFELVAQVIEFSTMYYSTRRPVELLNFNWLVDAKGNMETATDWEDWWSKFILPALQSRAFKRPFKLLPIGDYSYMRRFETGTTDFIKKMGNPKDDDPPPLDLGKIMRENFRFSNKVEAGLELVDVVTNATRRAVVGNLKAQGWNEIPSLMIHRKGEQYINMLSMQDDPVPNRVYPYARILKAYGRGGRPMIPANLRNKVW